MHRVDPEKEELAAATVRRMIVANAKPVRVQMRAPGNPVGGSSATLHPGKVVDSLNYDFKDLLRQGVRLVDEEKFDAMAGL